MKHAEGFTITPLIGGKNLVMINYSYTDFQENSRQKILYELGVNYEEIEFIIHIRQREELLGLDC